MDDVLLFAVFPYAAVAVAVFVGLYRYFSDRFSFSSFSSQFLESRALFWGSVPWHYGVMGVLAGHLLAFVFTAAWGSLVAAPSRLYVVETLGLVFAFSAVLGLGLLMVRRLRNARVFAVTSTMDWVLLVALLLQMVMGIWVALFHRWGAEWSLHTAVPWLASLVRLDPQPELVASLPWVVKLHMLGGFAIVGLFPFTRLVHLVTFPVTYLWRSYQVVIWHRRPRQA